MYLFYNCHGNCATTTKPAKTLPVVESFEADLPTNNSNSVLGNGVSSRFGLGEQTTIMAATQTCGPPSSAIGRRVARFEI